MQINNDNTNRITIYNDDKKMVGTITKVEEKSEPTRNNEIENYDLVFYNDEQYEGSSTPISFSNDDKVKKLTK